VDGKAGAALGGRPGSKTGSPARGKDSPEDQEGESRDGFVVTGTNGFKFE
jgi:hypothetical protein